MRYNRKERMTMANKKAVIDTQARARTALVRHAGGTVLIVQSWISEMLGATLQWFRDYGNMTSSLKSSKK